ncbi:MAG: leucine-rich repeat protein, partial [Bdellovibrionota bacterium]
MIVRLSIALTGLFLLTNTAYANLCDRNSEIIKAVQNEFGKENIYHKSCEQMVRDDLKKVKDLYIYNSSIFSAKDLEGMTNLEELSIGPDTTMAHGGLSQYAPQLLKLALHSIESKTLPKGVLKGLTNLEELYLQDGELTSLDEDVFSDLSKLKILNFRNNKLTELPPNIFKGLRNLELLDFAFQREYMFTQTLPKEVFSDLVSLKSLDMNNIIYLKFEAGLFSNLINLKELRLFSIVISQKDIDRIKKEAPQANIDYFMYDHYDSFKKEFQSSVGTGITVPTTNSFYSGVCYNKGSPGEAYIGGLYLDRDPNQYAVVMLQQPSEDYPITYADEISNDQDPKLKWLIVNNSRWDRYFYSISEFKPTETNLMSNAGEYMYTIKRNQDQLLVEFISLETDEG